MEFYKSNVLGLILINASIFYLQRRRKARKSIQMTTVISEAGKEALIASDAILRQFNWRFLPVYALVFGADWLQVRKPIHNSLIARRLLKHVYACVRGLKMEINREV